MNKIVKRILIVVGAVILLLIVAVGVIFVVIDPNDYRDELSQMAYKATGRQIEFRGDISLKILPSLAFSIKDVNVAQPEGFGEGAMAHVDELDLKMALFPLLKKEVQVDAVGLNGLTLNLIKNAEGHYNFEDQADSAGSSGSADAAAESRAQPPAASEPAASAGDSAEAEQRMHALLQSRIKAVSVRDCILNYTDIPAKENLAVRLNKLELGNVGLNRDITYALDVAAELDKNTRAALTMDGSARYDLGEKLLRLDVKSFAAGAEMPALFTGRQEVKGSLSGLLGGPDGRADLKAVLDSDLINGNVDIALGPEQGTGSLDLNARPVALIKALSPALQKELNLPPELLADNGPLRSLEAKLNFTQSGNAVNVSTAEVRAGGSDLVLSAPSLKILFTDQGVLNGAEGGLALKGTLKPYLPLAGIQPKGDAFSKLDGSLAFKLAGDDLTLSNLKLVVDDSLAALGSGKVAVRLAPAGPLLPLASLRGDFNVSARPRDLLDGLGLKPDLADPKALESFQSSFNLALDNVSLKLTGLKGKLDETEMSGLLELLLPGAAGIPRGASSYVKADLQLGSLNLDRYLPPDTESDAAAPQQGGSPAPATGAGGAAQPPLKGTPLEKAGAEISAGVKNLTVMQAPVRNVTFNATLSNGVLTVSRAALSAFQGQFNLSAKVDLVNAQGPGALKADLSNLNIGEALTVMLDEKRLSGTAGASLNLTFKGVDAANIKRSLNGSGKILIRNGKLHDFQLIPADAPAPLLKHRLSDYAFSDLGGSFTAVNGLLTNNDLSYQDKNLSLSGKGTINLVDDQLNYSAVIKTKETGSIPLLIKGSLSDPKISLDAEALARMALDQGKDALIKDLQDKGKLPQGDTPEERRQEAEKQIQEKLGQEVQRGLGKLFKK